MNHYIGTAAQLHTLLPIQSLYGVAPPFAEGAAISAPAPRL